MIITLISIWILCGVASCFNSWYGNTKKYELIYGLNFKVLKKEGIKEFWPYLLILMIFGGIISLILTIRQFGFVFYFKKKSFKVDIDNQKFLNNRTEVQSSVVTENNENGIRIIGYQTISQVGSNSFNPKKKSEFIKEYIDFYNSVPRDNPSLKTKIAVEGLLISFVDECVLNFSDGKTLKSQWHELILQYNDLWNVIIEEISKEDILASRYYDFFYKFHSELESYSTWLRRETYMKNVKYITLISDTIKSQNYLKKITKEVQKLFKRYTENGRIGRGDMGGKRN